jgi:zinc transport system permease protein
VSSQDLVWLVGASLALLVILAVFGREMFAVSFDPEVARTQGIRTGFIGVMITILAAVAVVIGMRTVGLLLVSAVMIVPIAAAQQVTRSFRGTAGVGILVGLFSAVGGVVTSFYLDVPSGATIVLITLACFVAALGLAAVIRRTA